MTLELHQLDVTQCAAAILAGRITSVDLVRGCLERIRESDGRIGAWRHLDEALALEQAAEMDALRQQGMPLGPLHGIPVGVKDIFDTHDMPTRHGSPIHEQRQPAADSAVVEKLREAGAVILGKTVTTEFAGLTPAGTRNPHDPGRTPGGSSSGSAAAVAAGHVPMAIGSQTSGSTIRPAAFCGVHGFKPSRGVVSRRGCLQTSATLDQVGVFARTSLDLALVTDALAGYDHQDGACQLRPRPRMVDGYRETVPVEPDFAWLEFPFDDRLSPSARDAYDELLEVLGARVERLRAPDSVAGLLTHQSVIREYELGVALRHEVDHHWDDLSEIVRETVLRGQRIDSDRYRQSLAMVQAAGDYFRQFFNDYDAIITPAAAGEAPPLAEGTGDPVFSIIWTFCGLPCLTLPLLEGASELPMGVQLVGSHYGDGRLLRTTRWLLEHLQGDAAAASEPEHERETR